MTSSYLISSTDSNKMPVLEGITKLEFHDNDHGDSLGFYLLNLDNYIKKDSAGKGADPLLAPDKFKAYLDNLEKKQYLFRLVIAAQIGAL